MAPILFASLVHMGSGFAGPGVLGRVPVTASLGVNRGSLSSALDMIHNKKPALYYRNNGSQSEDVIQSVISEEVQEEDKELSHSGQAARGFRKPAFVTTVQENPPLDQDSLEESLYMEASQDDIVSALPPLEPLGNYIPGSLSQPSSNQKVEESDESETMKPLWEFLTEASPEDLFEDEATNLVDLSWDETKEMLDTIERMFPESVGRPHGEGQASPTSPLIEQRLSPGPVRSQDHRKLMEYRFGMEEKQRQANQRKVQKAAVMNRSMQAESNQRKLLSYRLNMEKGGRHKETARRMIVRSRPLSKTVQRSRVRPEDHRKLMEYRFSMEERVKEANRMRLQAAEEKTRSILAEVNQRKLLSYRLEIENQMRRKQKGQEVVRSREAMMQYRLKREAKEKKQRKAQLAFDAHRKRLDYRLRLENRQRATERILSEIKAKHPDLPFAVEKIPTSHERIYAQLDKLFTKKGTKPIPQNEDDEPLDVDHVKQSSVSVNKVNTEEVIVPFLGTQRSSRRKGEVEEERARKTRMSYRFGLELENKMKLVRVREEEARRRMMTLRFGLAEASRDALEDGEVSTRFVSNAKGGLATENVLHVKDRIDKEIRAREARMVYRFGLENGKRKESKISEGSRSETTAPTEIRLPFFARKVESEPKARSSAQGILKTANGVSARRQDGAAYFMTEVDDGESFDSTTATSESKEMVREGTVPRAEAAKLLISTGTAAVDILKVTGSSLVDIAASFPKVAPPEKREKIKKDFAEGWLKMGWTVLEGAAATIKSASVAAIEYEKQKNQNPKVNGQGKKMESVLPSLSQMTSDSDKTDKLREKLRIKDEDKKERQRLEDEAREFLADLERRRALERIERDRVQVETRAKLLAYRFELEKKEREKRYELLLIQNREHERRRRAMKIASRTTTEKLAMAMILSNADRIFNRRTPSLYDPQSIKVYARSRVLPVYAFETL